MHTLFSVYKISKLNEKKYSARFSFPFPFGLGIFLSKANNGEEKKLRDMNRLYSEFKRKRGKSNIGSNRVHVGKIVRNSIWPSFCSVFFFTLNLIFFFSTLSHYIFQFHILKLVINDNVYDYNNGHVKESSNAICGVEKTGFKHCLLIFSHFLLPSAFFRCSGVCVLFVKLQMASSPNYTKKRITKCFLYLFCSFS